jgi:hypothetical protein
MTDRDDTPTAPATDVAAIAGRLRTALNLLDESGKDCPARKTRLGDRPCSLCGATARDGCRNYDVAAHAFIRKVRTILQQEQPPC